MTRRARRGTEQEERAVVAAEISAKTRRREDAKGAGRRDDIEPSCAAARLVASIIGEGQTKTGTRRAERGD